MEPLEVEVLDERDVELAETLRDLGLRKAEAYLVTYLHLAGPSVSRSVEVGTSLRQPEVSTASKTLEERDWLTRDVSDDVGDHRPMKVMELTVDLSEALDELREEREREYREFLDRVERAEELL